MVADKSMSEIITNKNNKLLIRQIDISLVIFAEYPQSSVIVK